MAKGEKGERRREKGEEYPIPNTERTMTKGEKGEEYPIPNTERTMTRGKMKRRKEEEWNSVDGLTKRLAEKCDTK